MKLVYINLIYFISLSMFSCNEYKSPTNDTATKQLDSITNKIAEFSFLIKSDTASIHNNIFVLSICKNGSTQYFKVERENSSQFETILVDSNYSDNNSDLFFSDQNNDGYLDIVWTKKWQDHSYLFNPQKDNFYEVGEFHTIDTLKIEGNPVFFKGQYPLLYFQNKVKEFEWMTEVHSELFVINSDFQKVSFATIDNFASLENWNFEKCNSKKSVVVECFVPPYTDKYGEFNIWNNGNTVDSIFMKADKFDSSFIANYWKSNYQKLLQYGTVFHVRHPIELNYY